jgi:hypothetical protein
MSVQAAQVEIQRPCPVELPEDFRGGARNRHCGHCDKTVHLLSSLTEAEATAFLERSVGRDVCVTYLVDARGDILFQPETIAPPIVPVSALRRPRLGAAAAVGLGLALAACAPHDNPRIEAQGIERAVDEPCESKPPVVPTEPHSMVAGGLGVLEPPPVVEEVPKLEPAKLDRPPMHAGKPKVRPPQQVRGGRG